MGVEAGAGSREDVQEGMDGGGGVTQVQNKIYKFLKQKSKQIINRVAAVSLSVCLICHTQVKVMKHLLFLMKTCCRH